jgi:hypothetical protein
LYADPTLLRHPIAQTSDQWYRNVDLFSIAYAFRPRLRVRLTLSGLTFLRKPWVFGERVSHPFYRYSCRHSHFRFVDGVLPTPLQPTTERSPTSPRRTWEFTASALGLSPENYRRRAIRPVSSYALFEWWLLLSQHPGCLNDSTSLVTLSLDLGALAGDLGFFPSRLRTLSPAASLPG